MFLVPMGENDDKDNRPSGFYKSANIDDVIDVDSNDENVDSELLPTDLNLYKRITKHWLIYQEVAGFSISVAVASFVFLLLRSATYFPFVIGLLGLAVAFVVMIFAFSWKQLRTIEKIRYFLLAVGAGLATIVAGHDLLAIWISKNQQITNGVLAGFAIIGLFVALKVANDYLNRRKRRY